MSYTAIDAAGRAVETNWTISSLTPFTWASGDEIVGSGFYEVA